MPAFISLPTLRKANNAPNKGKTRYKMLRLSRMLCDVVRTQTVKMTMVRKGDLHGPE